MDGFKMKKETFKFLKENIKDGRLYYRINSKKIGQVVGILNRINYKTAYVLIPKLGKIKEISIKRSKLNPPTKKELNEAISGISGILIIEAL